MTYNAVENTKILILCAGEHKRWANYLGIPKQLISINGESLLERMVRLLRNKGYYNIVIVSHDERLRLSNCGFFRPSSFRWIAQTLLSTYSLWTDKTIILLGDVFFTERAINTITKSSRGINVYGRPNVSRFTFTKYGEIFALLFDKNNWDKIKAHAEIVCRDAGLGGRGKLWEFYRSLAGYPLTEHKIENEIFNTIHDLTDDIDDPAKYDRIIRIYTYATSNNRYKRILVYCWIGLGAPLLYLGSVEKQNPVN